MQHRRWRGPVHAVDRSGYAREFFQDGAAGVRGLLASTFQTRDPIRIAERLRVPCVVLVGNENQLDTVDAWASPSRSCRGRAGYADGGDAKDSAPLQPSAEGSGRGEPRRRHTWRLRIVGLQRHGGEGRRHKRGGDCCAPAETFARATGKHGRDGTESRATQRNQQRYQGAFGEGGARPQIDNLKVAVLRMCRAMNRTA